MNKIKIITTFDGSRSLLNTDLNETYHSRHGAIQESKHVFIQNGLDYFIDQHTTEIIRILEVGFGTGLNTWLTLQHSKSKLIKIHYITLETFPLSEEIWQILNYASNDAEKKSFEQVHTAAWNETVAITDNFYLTKYHTSLQDAILTQHQFDVVYFDAFAPNKQPELWELPILKKITDQLSPNGAFVTYCAKGQVKRDLKSLGLEVEILQGPPGKREMIRAVKK